MLDGDSNADLKALKELGKFKILAYVTDENAVGIEKPAEAAGVWKAIEEDGEGTYIPRCRIRGTLENKIVRSKALLPFPDSVYSIINVSLDSFDTDDHPVYALVTDDLEHYKTYNFATKTWDGVDINSEDVAKNAFEMMKNGIRTSKISSIPEDDWKRLGARRIGSSSSKCAWWDAGRKLRTSKTIRRAIRPRRRSTSHSSRMAATRSTIWKLTGSLRASRCRSASRTSTRIHGDT